MTAEITIRDAKTGDLSTRTYSREGYLRGMAALTRAGVFDYPGDQVCAPNGSRLIKPPEDGRPDRVRILMSRESVFHPATAKSAAMKPLTLGHPTDDVDSKNFRFHVVGVTGENAKEVEGERLAIPIQITDANAVRMVESGKSEISIGYTYALENKPGVYKGEAYDLRSVGALDINHIAIVERGRAGSSVRVLDTEGDHEMDDTKIHAAIKDGLSEALKGQELASKAGIDIDKLAAAVAGPLEKTIEAQVKDALTAAETKAKAEADAQALEDAKPKLPGTPEELEALVEVRARDRASVLQLAEPFLGAKAAELADKPIKEILVAAMTDHMPDAAKQTEDTLRGGLQVLAAARKDARGSPPAVASMQDGRNHAQAMGGDFMAPPKNWLDIRKQEQAASKRETN